MKDAEPIDQEALGQHPAGGQTDETAQLRTDVDAAQNRERGFVHGPCLIEHCSAFGRERVAVATAVEQGASKQRFQARDPAGHGRVIDAQGASEQSTMAYEYDHWKNLTKTADIAGHATTIAYDLRGRKTQIAEPNA